MPWEKPRLTTHGNIHAVTQWIGGPWGEFFSGEGPGWNPWRPNPENTSVS